MGCEKITPKLFRLASETEEDEDLNKILQASDDMSLVISRYKMVILEGKPDVLKDMKKNAEKINENVTTSINQDQLLDLDISSPDPAAPTSVKKEETFDEDLLGLTLTSENPSSSSPTTESEPKTTLDNETKVIKTKIENLLDDSINLPESSMPVIPIAKKDTSEEELSSPTEDKTSRQRGFEELDFLGESLLKQHLPAKAPQFEKKKEEKLSLNLLQQKQKEKDLIPEPTKEVTETKNDKPKSTENGHAEVKLADLEVPLSSIKPGKTPPMPLQETEDGISIVLHFGQDPPREYASAIVVTVINKLAEAIEDYELKAVVPKGCKVKLQNPTTRSLPAHNPFVPASAITQVMLIANPMKKDVSFKYIVSYTMDGEPQTEMGQVDKLPI